MSPANRDANTQANARQRPRLHAQERLARDRRQAQHAAKILAQALQDLGRPAHVVAEIEGRLRSQHQLLGHIVGVMCPPLLRLMGCLVLFYTSRVICKGWLTMEEIICSLKHYWRIADCEALELQALSQRVAGKTA
jgi:hypothetical protein